MGRNNLEKTTPRRLKAESTYSRKCHRTRFATELDAKIATGGIDADHELQQCPNCGGWHILRKGEQLTDHKAEKHARIHAERQAEQTRH